MWSPSAPLSPSSTDGFMMNETIQELYSKIQTRIRKQVATYLPPVKILNIEFDDSNGDQYQLGLRIEYAIVNLGIRDWIDVFV